MSNKLTEWLNEPTLEDLKNDYNMADTARAAYLADLKRWEEITDGGKKLDSKNNTKSTARVKLVRKQSEWKLPDLEEPFLNSKNMFEVEPRTSEDVESASWNSAVLNYQWENKVGKTAFVGNVCRRLYYEGTAVIKVGWEYQEGLVTKEIREPVYAESEEEAMAKLEQLISSGEIDEIKAKELMESKKVPIGYVNKHVKVYAPIKNQPKYDLCENGNILADPTCTTRLSDAGFVIYDYDSNFAELKKYEYTEREDGSTFGYYHNLDLVKENMEEAGWDTFKPDSYTGNFEDKARKKFKVSEYWGYWDINGNGSLEPIVATWVGDALIRLGKNPFPHKKIPFTSAAYMPKKDSYLGEPDAELLEDIQKALGRYTRAIDDITSTAAVGQTLFDERLFQTESQRNNFKKKQNTHFTSGMDPNRAIYKITVDEPPSILYNMIQMYTQEAEVLSGTRAFAGNHAGQALTASATSIRSALDATGKRSLSIMRRLNEMFSDIAKMTISMNQKFLKEEEIIRLTNKEFITVRRDDLQGDFDIRINVSTPEKDSENSEKLMVLMQTQAGMMSPEVAKAHYVHLAKLMGQDALAKIVQETDTGPSETEIKTQEINLQNAQLLNQKLRKEIEEMDSRINERISRTEENTDADTAMKLARAKELEARAAKLRAEADRIDAEYLDNLDGITDKKELDKRLMEQEYELTKLQQQQNSKLQEQQLKHMSTIKKAELDGEVKVLLEKIKQSGNMSKVDKDNTTKLLIEQSKGYMK
jgi:hypothetical protein